jgi:hypothetical protein
MLETLTAKRSLPKKVPVDNGKEFSRHEVFSKAHENVVSM